MFCFTKMAAEHYNTLSMDLSVNQTVLTMDCMIPSGCIQGQFHLLKAVKDLRLVLNLKTEV